MPTFDMKKERRLREPKNLAGTGRKSCISAAGEWKEIRGSEVEKYQSSQHLRECRMVLTEKLTG